jgi:hypothetical protein
LVRREYVLPRFPLCLLGPVESKSHPNE